jgi:hypothetical protein
VEALARAEGKSLSAVIQDALRQARIQRRVAFGLEKRSGFRLPRLRWGLFHRAGDLVARLVLVTRVPMNQQRDDHR